MAAVYRVAGSGGKRTWRGRLRRYTASSPARLSLWTDLKEK
jgi:hypothetical protein